MEAKTRICIIDQDEMRRVILQGILGHRFEVTALAHPSELMANWPDADAAFVALDQKNLEQVRNIVAIGRKVLPIIAYDDEIDVDQALAAIEAGAIDCVDLLHHRRNLETRIELALSRLSREFGEPLGRAASTKDRAGQEARGKKNPQPLGTLKAGMQKFIDCFR